MIEYFLAFIFIGICTLFLGVGVLFFGKTASQTACGSAPKIDTEPCPSQKAGLCPIEDKTGILKFMQPLRLKLKKNK